MGTNILRGGIGGLIATGVMTIHMYIAKALGLLGTPPPKRITTNMQRRLGVPVHREPETAVNVAWVAAHVGYGVGSGVLFGLLRRFVPGPGWLVGPGYGSALWAISYLKIMPSLGLFPHPSKDSRSRTVVMISAHLVYGSVLAFAWQWLQCRRSVLNDD